MSRVTRFLKSRFSANASYAVRNNQYTQEHSFSTYIQNSSHRGKVFVQPYSIFKGKAALLVTPLSATPSIMNEGMVEKGRRGAVLLTFMPAIGERKYDSNKKKNFALTPTEVGSLISMGTGDSSEFYHDPAMMSSNAGQVRKSLSIKPFGEPVSGYFISLSVVDNIEKTNDRMSVPLTLAEFAVLKSGCNLVLPHILGWSELWTKKPYYPKKIFNDEWSK